MLLIPFHAAERYRKQQNSSKAASDWHPFWVLFCTLIN